MIEVWLDRTALTVRGHAGFSRYGSDIVCAAASMLAFALAEAVQAGNEYAQAQYGVTIDTTMTTADSSYFPGTADSVAWLAANGGQEALNRAARGNVEATFDYLAAMDGADTVSAYARFNCTVRYNAASDEYIVVVLYG